MLRGNHASPAGRTSGHCIRNEGEDTLGEPAGTGDFGGSVNGRQEGTAEGGEALAEPRRTVSIFVVSKANDTEVILLTTQTQRLWQKFIN